MSVSMYENSVTVFVRYLDNLSAILTKAAAHCVTKEIDESVLINARLYPDMLPLTRQVHIACGVITAGLARLAGLEFPSNEGEDITFVELQERIARAKQYLLAVPADQIDGTEDKLVTLVAGPNKEFKFPGKSYLSLWALPNVYFHITTTYNILRHNGVELGKWDFLGSFENGL